MNNKLQRFLNLKSATVLVPFTPLISKMQFKSYAFVYSSSKEHFRFIYVIKPRC